MICAFLLEPDVTRVVVSQFHDQHALVFGQRRCDLLNEVLLSLDINRREELILVDGLQKVLVFGLALLFGI